MVKRIQFSTNQLRPNLHPIRIRHEKKGGAWCPKDPINIQSEEFLQIDFNQSTKFTLIETQGRFDQGQVIVMIF